jgi:heme oxygenase
VTEVSTEAVPVGQDTTTLRGRLRAETARWHERVEAVADVPGSIRSRDDYVELLSRLYELHACLEGHLAAPGFHDAWRSVGVDIAAHRRASLLADDLVVLGASAPTGSLSSVPFATFGHALGGLYVLEGSSLGGRIVARLVRATLGDVPTTFLSGDGRSHPAPWSSTCQALACFDARGGDGGAVVSGACDVFAAFADRLSPGGPSHTITMVAPT